MTKEGRFNFASDRKPVDHPAVPNRFWQIPVAFGLGFMNVVVFIYFMDTISRLYLAVAAS